MATDGAKLMNRSTDKVNDGNFTEEKFPKERVHENGWYVLRTFAMISLLEGLCCLVAAYLDQTVAILPSDPLLIMGIVWTVAGLVMLVVSIVTRKQCQYRNHGFSCNVNSVESIHGDNATVKKEQ